MRRATRRNATASSSTRATDSTQAAHAGQHQHERQDRSCTRTLSRRSVAAAGATWAAGRDANPSHGGDRAAAAVCLEHLEIVAAESARLPLAPGTNNAARGALPRSATT